MDGVARTSLRIFGLLCLSFAVWMYMPRRPATPPAASAEPPAILCEAYPGETLTAMSLALFTSVLLFILHPRSVVS